ncbi:MAG: glycine--tRNA ligase [Verrucomicrobiae bacterium]|nr:glycine--tRNA ligase [Verrucomicrobiae bacterium]MDW7980313.1 glycine--tRNA ligase [Verrucomicrobiales bacterium]
MAQVTNKDASVPTADLMDRIVSLCKRRGFIYQSSEIYGGINGFWDYGPLGVELKNNIKMLWWHAMTRLRDDVVGLDATIIMHPRIWKASGHVDTFSDPMVDCKKCKGRFRADQLAETPCPLKPSKTVAECDGEKTEPRPFNLMFKTTVGPIESEENVAYLRPETAQAIFAQFKTVLETARQKVPFGIAQIGKAFRNEVTPRNYTFRSREFEQMELEFFIRPDEAVEAIAGRVLEPDEIDLTDPRPDTTAWGWKAWLKYWVAQRMRWYESLGLPRAKLVEYWQKPDELAHYAKACVDILFKFPFGKRDASGELIGEELEGIAARSDFDLSQHQRFSGRPMTVFDEELKNAWGKLAPDKQSALRSRYRQSRLDYYLKAGEPPEKARALADADAEAFTKGYYIPHVIEPSAGVDRLALALICNAYDEDTAPDEHGNPEPRVVLRFQPRVAPVKVAVFPLLKNRPALVQKAREVYELLRPHMKAFYDDAGAIGRRYRRQDEAGTPYCVTIDFETLGEKAPELRDTVTVRERDSMRQDRVKISELVGYLLEKIR